MRQFERADLFFDLLQEAREKVVIGRNAAGGVREFQLRLRIRFRVRDRAGIERVPETELLQQRDISFIETNVLAKETEEDLLYRNMQTDMVQQILWRLASLRPQTTPLLRQAAGHVELAEVSVEGRTTALNVSVGQLQERGLLGGYSTSALGLDASHRTLGMSASAAWRLDGRWTALASWSRTDTAAPQAQGMLLGGSHLRADAMGVGLNAQGLWQRHDRFSVAWLAPLKVNSGTWRYSVVTGVDDSGNPVYGEQTVNLGAGSREWQLDTRYQWQTTADSRWTAALTWRVHPDHDSSAPSQWAGGVRYLRSF